MSDNFVLDVTKIRAEVRQKMEEGPITETYGRDSTRVIEVLNDVVATEVVCWLRYTRHAISASGIDSAQVSSQFTDHAKEELGHALRVAGRVNQLGGEPAFDPAKLTERSATDYTTPSDGDLAQMLRDNLEAERIVISTYQEIIRWLGDGDPTSRRLMEFILAEEEDHADDLVDLLGI
ncbi:ferritin-like domain-containing protein [Actinomadura rayongensis]|jgi:bacterioferritin|uniref:Bacterioferritin n=1 Tax=Actinomadura rayongensis TaxID=1429076 RepID=A0A6I4W9R0_9ACTN|nr:ferritin-like domain-containing protein [Actinomadura rayongensis]MXQ66917.1 bacterioferritin [Actinomadura rayongensis]